MDVEDGEALLSRLVESVDPEASQKERDWQAQVRLNEAITGVKFTSVNWEIKHKGTFCVKLHLPPPPQHLSVKSVQLYNL